MRNVSGALKNDLKVEIFDLGADCLNNAIFNSNDSVEKTVRVVSDDPALPGLYFAEIKL